MTAMMITTVKFMMFVADHNQTHRASQGSSCNPEHAPTAESPVDDSGYTPLSEGKNIDF